MHCAAKGAQASDSPQLPKLWRRTLMRVDKIGEAHRAISDPARCAIGAQQSPSQTQLAKACERNRFRWNFLERGAAFISPDDPTFQSHRDFIFRPVAKVIIRMGIAADVLSVAGCLLAIFAATVMLNPWLSALLLVASLLLDGIDGVVARLARTANTNGEILDIACDTSGIVAAMSGLVYWGHLDLFGFIIFSIVYLSYVFVSAIKSKAILGKYRSVGSRVVLTSYLVVCLGLSGFQFSLLSLPQLISYGTAFITIMLLLNLLWDILNLVSGEDGVDGTLSQH
jgi:phosphatidylglycerophosphate synthase